MFIVFVAFHVLAQTSSVLLSQLTRYSGGFAIKAHDQKTKRGGHDRLGGLNDQVKKGRAFPYNQTSFLQSFPDQN